jgi:Tol biopolymer transport system component
MPLLPGTRLGPYEVIAPLGAGGMGEVYRARDARLGREVAAKVLPSALAADGDRLARFEKEARATGALNHPNILAIHDLGTHEGIPYLVCELLEGQTLRERLSEGPLPARKATELMAQAARGLAAAHERGIVHRDLKPENLFVTRDGRMKILDFGLAKLTAADTAAGPVTNLPTTPAGTQAGVILGTVGYMAPEQVRGHPADARSDLFALGACLYEAVTGRRAFTGDTAVEVLHAILKTDPADLVTLDPSLPPALGRIVGHCLEKSPDERYQTARDVAFSLETFAGASGGTGAPAALPGPAVRSRRAWLLSGAALLAAALTVGGMLRFGPGTASPVGPPVFTRLTFRHGFVHSARFANGGRSIVFGAAWDDQPIGIYLGQPGSPEARMLGVPGWNVLAVSPSDELAVQRIQRTPLANLYRASGTLVRVPLNGGTPRDIAESVTGADWAPDGARLAVARDLGDHRRLEYPVGTLLYETPHNLFNPRISPDGRQVAFWENVAVGSLNSIMLIDATGTVRTLSPGWNDWWYLSWSPDGREIWFGASTAGFQSTVYAVDLDGHRRTLYAGQGGYDVQDVLADGRALLGSVKQRYHTVGVLGGWDRPRDLSWFDGTRIIDIDADGTAMLLAEESEAGGPDFSVYLQRADGAPPVRLGEGRAIALSPDGRLALAFRAKRDLVLLPIGAGTERTLASGTFETILDGRFLPDGKRIVVLATQAGRRSRLFFIGADEGGITPLGNIGFETTGSLAVSPDGRRIAAVSADGRVALVPTDGGPPAFESSLRVGDQPIAWSADGAALYVFRRESVPTAVEQVDLRSGRRKVWKEIALSDPAGVSNLQRVVMTSDARAWAYSWQQVLTDLYLVEGLR